MDLGVTRRKASSPSFKRLVPRMIHMEQILLLCALIGHIGAGANDPVNTPVINSSNSTIVNVGQSVLSSVTSSSTVSVPKSSIVFASAVSSGATTGVENRSEREVNNSTDLPLTSSSSSSPEALPQASAFTGNEPAAEEKLKKALLNHSHHLHDMDGEDLDKLVLSQLPEGSKLILRSVKIVRTDGDDGEDSGEEATSWDVLVKNNGTRVTSRVSSGGGPEPRERREPVGDLVGASSHSEAHYDSEGANQRTKQRDNKYHHHRNHGEQKTKTITDTDGSKVTNYDGKEAGVTDFAKAHGNSERNEGGRYKDSKKKNKGRKVTGFKRIYHKEEFQRTEHFYDDEEAKRIAESFGNKDEKEKSSHGLKDDDRKYHGTHREHTDGHKVKNEHGTTNSYDKGHHQNVKDSERHKSAQQYGNRHRTAPVHGNQHRTRPRNYENHNYEGAYSNPATAKFTRRPTSTTEEVMSTTSAPPAEAAQSASSATESDVGPPPRHIRKFPRRWPQRQQQQQQQSVQQESSNNHQLTTGQEANVGKPNFAMTAPLPALTKPPEMKTFFSPRYRHYPYSTDDKTMAYAPNFAPSEITATSERVVPVSYSYSFRTVHPTKQSSDGRNESKHPSSTTTHQHTRYAGDFPTGNMIDPVPEHYSTLTSTLPRKNLPARGNLISIEKAKGLEYSGSSNTESMPTSTGHYTEFPMTTVVHSSQPHIIQHNHMPIMYHNRQPVVTWIPLGHGSSNSDHNYAPPPPPPRPTSNAIPPSSSYPKFQFNPLRIGKTLIPNMFLRHPSTSSPVIANYRPRPSLQRQPIPPPGAGGGGSGVGSFAPHGSPSSVHYSKRNPQFSKFMNGLMDSVSGFFGRIG